MTILAGRAERGKPVGCDIKVRMRQINPRIENRDTDARAI
jgi:hypothetical protein